MTLFLSAVHMCLSVQNTFCPCLTQRGLFSYLTRAWNKKEEMRWRVHFSNWRNKEFLCETDLIMVSRNSIALLKNIKIRVCHVVPSSSRHWLNFKNALITIFCLFHLYSGIRNTGIKNSWNKKGNWGCVRGAGGLCVEENSANPVDFTITCKGVFLEATLLFIQLTVAYGTQEK